MKVFSIIGNKKMRENIEPKIIKALEDDGNTVGFIKCMDNISSNSHTKKAVIWGDHQSLFYHEDKSTLTDLLNLFDEEYIIIDNDEDSNVPKLLMNEKADLDKTADVSEFWNIDNMDERDDVFFTADGDTELEEIISEIKKKVFEVLPDMDPANCDDCGRSCREMTGAILKGMASRDDCTLGKEDIELFVGDEKLKMVPFVKSILKNSVEAVAHELNGYKDGSEIKVVVRKR